MTPREPDRYEEKGVETWRALHIMTEAEAAPIIAAALRLAREDALNEAAQRGDSFGLAVGDAIRALASPAAAPAVRPDADDWKEDFALEGAVAPAAEKEEDPYGTHRICPVCRRSYWRRGSQEGEQCRAADCKEPAAPAPDPEYPHRCEACGRDFSTAAALEHHEEAWRGESGPDPRTDDPPQETIAARDRRIAQLEAAIRWALGEEGDFRSAAGAGRYWWRTELRRRAALADGGE
jgi:hypothetical protein